MIAKGLPQRRLSFRQYTLGSISLSKVGCIILDWLGVGVGVGVVNRERVVLKAFVRAIRAIEAVRWCSLRIVRTIVDCCAVTAGGVVISSAWEIQSYFARVLSYKAVL